MIYLTRFSLFLLGRAASFPKEPAPSKSWKRRFWRISESSDLSSVSMGTMIWICAIIGPLTCPPTVVADSPNSRSDIPIGNYISWDTLAPSMDSIEDANVCLSGLTWKPEIFEIACNEATNGRGDCLIRFPSAVSTGFEENDSVAMEWYIARDKEGSPIHAPAIVVVHESGSGMTVGRLFAQGLKKEGLHTFMIHLPGYGERRPEDGRRKTEHLIIALRQSISDVRRARDAVSVLPYVDSSSISVQGTSLGGFVTATTAAIDRGFDNTFILLAGGGLYDLIQSGQQDAAKVREELAAAGFTGDKLRVAIDRVEPLRLAHRLDPQRTWLYSGTLDRVVPAKHAEMLSDKAGLDKAHHHRMLADHYSGIIFVPFVLKHIRGQVFGED